MKYLILSLLLVITSLFSSESTFKKFENLSPIKERNIKVKEFKLQDGIYMLRGTLPTKRGERSIMLFVSKDLKYTFFGRVVNNETGENLYLKKSLLPYKSLVNFTYGSGKEEYYLFIDPQCPYCQKFEQNLAKLNIAKKVKIHYFLFPLAFHSEARGMSKYIISQKDNASKLKALSDVVLEHSAEYKNLHVEQKELNAIDEQIASNIKIVNELAIQGTPTLLKPDGTKVNIADFLKEMHVN